MSEHNEEVASLRNVLNEITELAEGASLTGMLSGGQGRAVSRFNAIASRLVELGAIQKAMYEPLPGDAGFADVAIEARLLAAQIAPTKDKHKHEDNILMRLAPFVDSQDLAELVREQMRKGSDIDMHQLSSLAPFLDRTMLGELLRAQMSNTAAAPEAPQAPPPPQAPQPASASNLPVARNQEPKPEDLLELLRNPHLSQSERQELVQRLTDSVS